MANDYFQFKRFRIEQAGVAMKVNTDGVLLGAWVDVTGARRVLDIGTGTGIIAIQLAQRTEFASTTFDDYTNRDIEPVGMSTQIDAVEIDAHSAWIAKQNIAASPWLERIRIYNCAVQKFYADMQYDLIVSNPPYFLHSLTAPNPARNNARHANNLTYSDLITAAKRLLSHNGRFAVILPAGTEEQEFLDITTKTDIEPASILTALHLHRRVEVFSRPTTLPKRVMLEFGRLPRSIEHSTLIIEDAAGFTAEYRTLTRDFYLKF